MTTTIADKPRALWRLFNKLNNPLMKWLLRSALHGIVSHKFALISFTGRKSGKTYTTPVQYAQQDNTLYIITSVGYLWWKNLQGGAAVQLRLRGKDVAGTATTATDKPTVETLLQAIYPNLKPETRQKFADRAVAVMIELA